MDQELGEKQYCISSPSGRESQPDILSEEQASITMGSAQENNKLKVMQNMRQITETFAWKIRGKFRSRLRKSFKARAERSTLVTVSRLVIQEISPRRVEDKSAIGRTQVFEEKSNEAEEGRVLASEGVSEKTSNRAEENLVESNEDVCEEMLNQAGESLVRASEEDFEKVSNEAGKPVVGANRQDDEKVPNQADKPVVEASRQDFEKVSNEAEKPVVKVSRCLTEKNSNAVLKKKSQWRMKMWPSWAGSDFSTKLIEANGDDSRTQQEQLIPEDLPRSLANEGELKMNVNTKEDDEGGDVPLLQSATSSEDSGKKSNSAPMVLEKNTLTKMSIHSDEQDTSNSILDRSSSHSADIHRNHGVSSGSRARWKPFWPGSNPLGRKTPKTIGDDSNSSKRPRPLPADILYLMDKILKDDSSFEVVEKSEDRVDPNPEAKQTSESFSNTLILDTSSSRDEGESMETNVPIEEEISNSISGPSMSGSGKIHHESHSGSSTSDFGKIHQESPSGKKSRWKHMMGLPLIFGNGDHSSKTLEDVGTHLQSDIPKPTAPLSQEEKSEKVQENIKKEEEDTLDSIARQATSDTGKLQVEDDNQEGTKTGWHSFIKEDSIMQLMGMPQRFSYEELSIATGAFSEDSKLGQGGFGNVYQGVLPRYNVPVAVKKIHGGSLQGEKEFMAEVSIISQLRHRNLIQILGWCKDVTKETFLLVYELMPNGSLDKALFGRAGKETACLSWQQRYNIVTGAAAALDYLHQGLKQQVIHRDIKSSNIMLDEDWNAKLGDFGLARLVDHQQAAARTIVAGTPGYIAPEVFLFGRFTDKTDVFSFGVLILEVACGRQACSSAVPPEESNLVNWVWDCNAYCKGNIDLLSAVDRRLEDYDKQKMKVLLTVGLLCTRPEPEDRPPMRHVVQMLAGDMPLPSLPVSQHTTGVLCSVSESVSMDDLGGPKTGSSSTSRSGVGELETTFAQMIGRLEGPSS